MGSLGILIGSFTTNVSAAADTHTWDGGGANALASTQENWVSDIAPEAGDSVVWNAGALACTWDLGVALNTWTMNSAYTGTITLGVDFSVTAFTMAVGTLAGAGYTITCSGAFAHSAGTISIGSLGLIMTGDGTTLRSSAQFLNLDIQANIAQITDTCYSRGSFNLANGKTFTITGATVSHRVYLIAAEQTFTNSGTISGTGIFGFIIGGSGVNPAVTFGQITCAGMEINTYSGAAASATLILGAAANIPSTTLGVWSLDSSKTCTLDLSTNNYALTTKALLIATRAIFNARASTITCGGGWTSSSTTATFTQGTSTVVLTGTGYTIATGAAQIFYNLQVSGRYSATTSINVSHDLTVDNGKLFTIGSGKTLEYGASGGGTYSNLGTIAGSGTMRYAFDTADCSLTFGTIATNLTWIWAKDTATANRILTLTDDSLFCGSLLLSSSHASYWMVFDTRGVEVTIRNTFTNGTRGMVYYAPAWEILNLSLGSYPYNYQINTAGDAYYAQNMLTGLIELTEVLFADNVTQYVIDNSLTDAEISFANGTYVFRSSHDFYAGGWNCSVYLNITNNVTVSGSGASILTYRDNLVVAAGKGVTIFYVNDQSTRLTFQNLSFRPSTGLVATFKAPIFLHHPTGARPGFSNLTIQECWFGVFGYALWGDGVYYMGANNRIINNTFAGSGIALHNSPSRMTISGNTFISSGIGVFVDSVSNAIISNNTFVNVVDYGVIIYDAAKWTYVQDNTMIGSSQTSSLAIKVDKDTGKPDVDNTTIRRNAFTKFKWGVQIEGANDTTIEDNAFLSVTLPIIDGGTRTTVKDNLNYSYGPSFSGAVTLAWNYVQFSDGLRLYFTVFPTQTWVNATLSGTWRWSVSIGDPNVTLSYTISNLPNVGYKVYKDGQMIYVGYGPSFAFDTIGTSDFEIVAWYSKDVSQMIMLAFLMLCLGVFISVAVAGTSPLKDPENRRPEKMVKVMINMAVYVVISLLLLTVVYKMFIGG